jgi:hypothetical protein
VEAFKVFCSEVIDMMKPIEPNGAQKDIRDPYAFFCAQGIAYPLIEREGVSSPQPLVHPLDTLEKM